MIVADCAVEQGCVPAGIDPAMHLKQDYSFTSCEYPSAGWRVGNQYEALDCEIAFRFPVAKLAHYAEQEAALETAANPFALLTLAYLHTRATRSDMAARFAVKCRLIRMLYARNWQESAIREFLKVIDWMMALPPGLEKQLNFPAHVGHDAG